MAALASNRNMLPGPRMPVLLAKTDMHPVIAVQRKASRNCHIEDFKLMVFILPFLPIAFLFSLMRFGAGK